jgi:hypothetical protein
MTRRSGSVRHRRLLIAAAILLVGAASYAAPGGLIEALAYLLPALVLLFVLSTRSYPGERALLALIEKRRERRRDGTAARPASRSRLRSLVPRGGRLLASSLAERAPPLAAVSLI